MLKDDDCIRIYVLNSGYIFLKYIDTALVIVGCCSLGAGLAGEAFGQVEPESVNLVFL